MPEADVRCRPRCARIPRPSVRHPAAACCPVRSAGRRWCVRRRAAIHAAARPRRKWRRRQRHRRHPWSRACRLAADCHQRGCRNRSRRRIRQEGNAVRTGTPAARRCAPTGGPFRCNAGRKAPCSEPCRSPRRARAPSPGDRKYRKLRLPFVFSVFIIQSGLFADHLRQ